MKDARMASAETAHTQRRYDRHALLYDLAEAPVEWLAFKKLRKRLWQRVNGGMIPEVGMGTGKNLPYHPKEARTVALDLSMNMLQPAVQRTKHPGQSTDLLLADSEHLPFRDGVFDAVTATFVFCSVPDPAAGSGEVRRVVRAEGEVHLLERVRSQIPLLARIMDLANPIAVRLTGANINRNTVTNVAGAGIALGDVESHGFGIFKAIHGSRNVQSPRMG
jgi:ubiquinone/menaquinone biosynthesis C-methylase UbiE